MKKQQFNEHVWKDLLNEEIVEIYEPYHRDTYVGRNPAILAIDLYRSAYLGANVPVHVARTPGTRFLTHRNCLRPHARPAFRSSIRRATPTPLVSNRPIGR